MSRTVTSAVDAAFAGDNVPLLVFVQFDFDSGTSRITNNAYDVTWDGHTWRGLGELGSIDPVQEGADLQAYSLAMQLSGVPVANIAVALEEQYQGRACTIWAAPLSASYAVLADPVIVFKGLIDDMPVKLGKTATVQVNVQSRLADWDRPRVRRYNDADQQAAYPGDRGLEFVEQMVEKQFVWGRG